MMCLPVFAPVPFETDNWRGKQLYILSLGHHHSVTRASSLKNTGKIQDSWLYDFEENNALERAEQR